MKNLKLSAVAIIMVLATCGTESKAQNQTESKYAINEDWRHQNKYDRIINASCFEPGMSDDEMAGIFLWRGGRNLKMSFAFILVGFVSSSTLAYIEDPPAAVQIAIAGVSTGFLIARICELVSGYSKIGKAGIILQHKKFNIKTTGTSVSVNF